MLFSEYGEKFRLSNLLICEKEKKIILSVSGWKNGGDGIWIYKFNQTHENCRIEVKEYALEDYQTALMRLNADMVSESSPDLIDLSDIDAAPYITKGASVNLTPFFESSPETKKRILFLIYYICMEKTEKYMG